MSNFERFDPAGVVQIEVVEDGATRPRGGNFSDNFAKALRKVVEVVAESVRSLSEEQSASHVELSFVLTARPAGGFAITNNISDGSFRVVLKLARANSDVADALGGVPGGARI